MNRRTLRLVLLIVFVALIAVGLGMIGSALITDEFGIGVGLVVAGAFGWFHLQQTGSG